MNNGSMMDVDPLSPYGPQYEYPIQNPHYYQPPPDPQPVAYVYKDEQPSEYPEEPYQPLPIPGNLEYGEHTTENYAINAEQEEEDIKPDIVPKETEPKRRKKTRGKTSNYWNKKITDKDFAFYGCSVCNIAFKDIQKLDQHVVIHTNRLTSYDLRIINLKKRKRLKKAKKKLKKETKVKQECEIEIKPEDGYIGSEKASEFIESTKQNTENNENTPKNNKNTFKNNENSLKCDENTPKNNENTPKNNENTPKNNENTPDNSKSERSHVNVYKCFGCNKEFALSYYLRIHVRSHTDEKPYTCSVCGQGFITASKLGRHTKRIHLAIKHQCRICYKIFSRFELLVKHFDKKHPADKIEGEPYDYNAILPYLKELEEELKLQKEKKPKTEEDPWGLPPFEPHTEDVPAKEEIFETKEEDKVILPTNMEFFDESKEYEVFPTTNITLSEVKVDVEIKQEVEDDHDDRGDQIDDQGDDHFADDDGVKNEDTASDEEYIPSETWVLPHSPLTKGRKRKLESSEKNGVRKKNGKKADSDAVKIKTGSKPFHCDTCGRGYSSPVTLKRHVATHDHSEASIKQEIQPKKEPPTETVENVDVVSEAATDADTADDPGSDEEYFPSKTWVRPPSPLPEAETARRKTTCEICHKQLCSKTYLAVHMRTHTGEKPFSCYICHRGFITASKMHRHVLTHDECWEGKDKIKPEDGEEVKPEVDAKQTENGEDTTEIPKDDSKLLLKKTKKTFFEKKEKKCKKWTHVCEFCNQKFLHLETLQVHKKSHDEGENMKCYYCLEPFSSRAALREHERAHAGPKPYLCAACGHTYAKRGAMVFHRKKCKGDANGDKKFVCEFCNKAYNAQSKLQRHVASHAVSQYSLRFECPVCAHMFHTRYHVRMHLRSHIKEGLILEENRNAVLAMVLQNARKVPKSTEITAPTTSLPDTGTDERSRICNICGQIFQHFYYLEEHLKTHGSKLALEDFEEEEEKKHTCQVCSKSFKLPYYLKLHSYTHTKEKPFICQQCGKGFITKGKLKRHLETHQGLKKYQCHICYKFFTRPSYLRIHVRTIHGTQDYNFRDYGLGAPIVGLSQD